jgi:tRNA threonylcarbamoyladenosine biosynthesis protein TsaE
MQKIFRIEGLDDIDRIASEVIQLFPRQRLLAFWGPMGVGKTTFIKAICKALKVHDTVNSPSFAIVNEYVSGNGDPIYHFDFYRIKHSAEAFDMGYEDYLYSGAYCFLEWPEKLEDLLPTERLDLVFELQDDGSRVLQVEEKK